MMVADPPPDGCFFCAIVAGARPAAVVYEDASTLAFLDITEVVPGHTLVIPKAHVTDLWEIAPEHWTSVASTVHRIARRIGEVLQPDGMTLFQANRDAGWQDVFHLHVHVVPRAAGDHLHRPWGASPVPIDTLEGMRARLFIGRRTASAGRSPARPTRGPAAPDM